jgi:glutaredoxin-like protein
VTSSFSAEAGRAAADLLLDLERPVELALVLGPYDTTTIVGARELDPEEETRKLLHRVAAMSPLVTVTEHGEGAFGADRYPATIVLADGVEIGMRFYGTPWGYELASLVGAVREAGRTGSSLTPQSLEALASVDRPLDVEVYVTPTCPNCPRAVLAAFRAAAASPLVRAAGVEATEFPAHADRHGVVGVPKVVVNGTAAFEGLVPETVFVERLVAAAR